MKKKCEFEYKPFDKVIIFNDNDPNLTPVPINQLDVIRRTFHYYGLKEPEDFPDFKLIEGYGLNPENQMFQREIVHPGVIQVEQKVRRSIKKDLAPMRRELTAINAFWEELENNQEKYEAEINWINLQWYYRLFGKFFFCHGKATYITGSYWDFLNNWTIQGAKPDYRDRDRRWQLAVKYTELDTQTFAKFDKDKKAIPESDGTYQMIELGRRVWYGMINTKVRRAGDSSKSAHNNTEYVTRSIEQAFGIQGMDDSNAQTMFTDHVVSPYNTSYPIYFKPLRESSEKLHPKTEKMTFSNDENPEIHSLKSKIDFATSADALKYDGKRVDRFLIDESGKTANCDIIKRHGIIKYCLSHGSEIRGHALYPTTVDTIEDRSAGERFMNMCFDSMWDKRDENGQTTTGLGVFHFRATDGLHPYIDQFGASREIEALKYINGKINYLKRNKKFQELADFKRQHPILFKDNFSIAIKNQFFNKEILETRADFLNFEARNLLPIQGNFYRKEWPDGDVYFTKEDGGRFFISIDLLDMANRYGSHYRPNTRQKDVNGIWYPVYPMQFIAGADPFGLNRTLGRASMGGGAVRWRWDKKIDPPEKPISEYLSKRPVCTYSARPDLVKGIPDSFCEDMLMMTQYFNAMMNAENNINSIEEWFMERKYDGYLLHEYDSSLKPRKSGWWHGEKTAQAIFNHYKDDISNHAKRWVHPDLINECLNIIDVKDMTDWDLFTAYGGCLLAELNPFYNMMLYSQDNQIDVLEMMETYEY